MTQGRWIPYVFFFCICEITLSFENDLDINIVVCFLLNHIFDHISVVTTKLFLFIIEINMQFNLINNNYQIYIRGEYFVF